MRSMLASPDAPSIAPSKWTTIAKVATTLLNNLKYTKRKGAYQQRAIENILSSRISSTG
jgi:hypothetical protein